jgi:membrane-bound lytic murein transglycosylase MltF
MRNKRRTYTIILSLLPVFLLTGILYLTATTGTSPRDFKEIDEEKIIRVVTEYSATGYFVSDDSIAGFQYELCRAMERHFGWKAVFFPENNLAASIFGLKEQHYDLIARNISVTTENRKDILFLDPIFFDRQILVQRKARYNRNISPIRNQIDLGGKSLYVPEHSPGILRLKNLSEEIADTIHIMVEKRYAAEQLIYMVAGGDIDFAVVDRRTAQKYREKYPALDIETDIGFTQIQSWAVRRDSPVLFDSINNWLNGFKTSREFSDLMKKYSFSAPAPPGNNNPHSSTAHLSRCDAGYCLRNASGGNYRSFPR